MKRIAGILILLLVLIPGAAAAELPDSLTDSLDLEGLEAALPSEAASLMGEGGVLDSSFGDGLSSIWKGAAERIAALIREGAGSVLAILAAVLLCGIGTGLYESSGAQRGLGILPMIGTLAVGAVALGDVRSLAALGADTIQEMDAFSKVLIPTVTTAAAAAGNTGGAVARQMAAVLFSDLLITGVDRLLLPLVYSYLAVSVAASALENEGLERLAVLIRKLTAAILTGMILIFTAYLTISGVIAGSTDALSVKATKTAISAMVPVVGKIISDAAETVLAGAGIVKNAVGIFGLLAVAAICVLPFLRLGIHYLLYKLAAAVAATVGDKRLVKLIDNIGGAFGLLLGMVGSCALMLMVSLVTTIMTAVR